VAKGGCGHENPDGAKFCSECGGALVAGCPSCAAPVAATQKYCGECGVALGPPERPGAGTAHPTPPEPVARRILGERRELEGERKQVTVLFADVSGSMDLAEGVGADDWARIMDQFFALLTDSVHRYDGTVDKFTGDGVMALFGAPVAYEDHARRAAHAALAVVDAVDGYATELRQTLGLAFHVRVGLNSGEVVVGRIGDDARMEYTALGHTVGLAQRMESLAEPGTAYLSEHTGRLLGGGFRLRDLGPCVVKGASEPVRVHVLEGTAQRRRGLSRWPGRAPLVGRAQEMATLEAALAQAIDGHGQVVGVVGEPGVGKSRLCEEFARSVAERGVTVRRASGLSHARAIPLLPILELLRDIYGITDVDSPRTARERIAGRLLLLDPELASDLPLMFDFLEVPDPDRPAPRLSGEVRVRHILDIVRRVSRRRSEGEPLVLLLEDMHWFDAQSAAFVGEMIRLYPGTRTLVVANFRPEFSADWMRQSYYRQLPVTPLPGDAVGEILDRLLGTDPSLVTLVPHIVERTAGNPFFVEEVVRTLVEDGALTGEPGTYRLSRPVGELRVPATVQATLAARIDRLSEQDKAVLQTASVIGRSFSEPVLAAVAARSGDLLDPVLRSLCAAEFLQESSAAGVAEYRFWHPLTQEVAYGSLLSGRRERLHAATAAALVDSDPARRDERAALIATHFQAAGDGWGAAQWTARAALWASRTSMDEATRRWRGVIDHLARVEPTEDALRLGVQARGSLLRVGGRQGMSTAEADALMAEGQASAEQLGDPGLLGLFMANSAASIAFRGEMARSYRAAEEAYRLALQSDDPDRRAAVALVRCTTFVFTGTIHEGFRAIREAFDECGGDPQLGEAVLGYGALCRVHCVHAELLGFAGRLDEARTEQDRGIAMARELGYTDLVAWGLPFYGWLDWLGGTDEGGLEHAAHGVHLAHETGNAAAVIYGLLGQGMAEEGAGRPRAAIELLQEGLRRGRERNIGWYEAATLTHLASALLDLGDRKESRDLAVEAVTLAQRQGSRLSTCSALLTRARAARLSGEPGSALDDLAAADALAEDTGGLAYRPFVTEERARLTEDRDLLAAAAEAYRAAGARGHAGRLDAELADHRL
jgi:class 3 adenylate cyclase/tetratricopeptide (TPR) repeat protein